MAIEEAPLCTVLSGGSVGATLAIVAVCAFCKRGVVVCPLVTALAIDGSLSAIVNRVPNRWLLTVPVEPEVRADELAMVATRSGMSLLAMGVPRPLA